MTALLGHAGSLEKSQRKPQEHSLSPFSAYEKPGQARAPDKVLGFLEALQHAVADGLELFSRGFLSSLKASELWALIF